MEAFIEGIKSVENGNNDFLHVFFAGCNFKCPWCNTPHLLESKEEYNQHLRDIKSQIQEFASSIEGVIFTGGEPCLQRLSLMNLAAFCKEKQLKVHVHTNGSKPGCINSLIQDDLVDSFILDLKSPLEESFEKITKSKTFFINTKQIINDIKSSIELLKNSEKELEIRTTIIPGWMYRKEDILKIADLVKNIECRWKLQRFEPSEQLASKKLQDIMPPSFSFMENLKEAINKEYPNIRVYIED